MLLLFEAKGSSTMLIIGLLNLLLAAGVVAGLVTVCLLPRLSTAEPRSALTHDQPAAEPDRLAA
jgi:hypothetical protein